MMSKYYKRIMDDVLNEELEAFGAVLITGPKWCGKTTTAKQIAKSVLYMQQPDEKQNNLQLAQVQPSLLLNGEKPRLIDEWQMAPQLWDAIRFDVDQKSTEGLYILTGSTVVDESKISHSGAGRISRLTMRTMSLFESKDSNGAVSLGDLFKGEDNIGAQSDLGLTDIADLVVRGGWPNTINKSKKTVMKQIAGYCNTIANSDIGEVDGIKRDEGKTLAILRSFSRHIATQASMTTILKDIKANNETMDIDTLSDYLKALEKLFVVEDLTAWSPLLRSKTAIRTSNTRHFTDPAIAAKMLNASPKDLILDLKTFGFLFESLVVRDLRIYAQSLEGRVFHYRDKTGLEADAIIHLDNGDWGAIEVKLGQNRIDEGAENLLKLEKKIDTDKMSKPTFLAVITGTKYAYKREDGVLVIPIGCLRP